MREIQSLDSGWLFKACAPGVIDMPDRSEEGWEQITIPHDWAIYGEFSAKNDPQPMENSIIDYHPGIVQIGRSGGLPIIGTGWYALELYIPGTHQKYALEFDGIMSRGKVFFNGTLVADRPYGYSSFCADISPLVIPDKINKLVVRVDSLEQSSRWYPGAGIYRPVRLVMTDDVRIAYQGIWVRAKYSGDSFALLNIDCTLEGNGQVYHTVFGPDGRKVLQITGSCASAELTNPALWSPDYPNLYTLLSEVLINGSVVDRVFTRFGVRSIRFDKNEGFFLNGEHCRINGVCLHHDFGMLGAAYNSDAAMRQMTSLKRMGCNAIRTTHNPPAPQLLDLCDELGIMVLDEAFDEWLEGKVKNGYCSLFKDWAETDLSDMIRRDRNHPSVIIYSVGNEVPDQVYPHGREICRQLVSICHREDPTRPVVCAFSRPDAAIENGLAEELDLVGLNYSAERYKRYHAEHPNWCFLATETVSCVSSRGEYHLPAVKEKPVIKHENLQVNSFDMSYVPYCYTPDEEFDAQDECPFVCGEFVWTGFDYLGEPTPYRVEWPSRSSYFGIHDLAGLPKDRYWAYAAKWSKQDILHIFPHWNWQEGEIVDVHCYTNLDVVRLFLNGKMVGEQPRKKHRIVFPEISFEPGELKAVGYRIKDGRETEVCTDIVRTAGAPSQILITPEKACLRPGETGYVQVTIADECGTPCPNADNRVDFTVNGAGKYIASDAGDPTCTRVFSDTWCQAFHGKLVFTVKAEDTQGIIKLEATADGLRPAVSLLEVK